MYSSLSEGTMKKSARGDWRKTHKRWETADKLTVIRAKDLPKRKQ